MPRYRISRDWGRAGLSFAVLRSVKGNLTRTTSPHPLSDLKPIRDFREDHLKLSRWKLAEEFDKLFGCDLKPGHKGFLLHGKCMRGVSYSSTVAGRGRSVGGTKGLLGRPAWDGRHSDRRLAAVPPSPMVVQLYGSPRVPLSCFAMRP